MKVNLMVVMAAAVITTACSKNGDTTPDDFPVALKAVAMESQTNRLLQSLLFPIIIYKLSRRTGATGQASISVSSGKLFNEFNNDFLTTLADYDTVAYQQNYVRYSK